MAPSAATTGTAFCAISRLGLHFGRPRVAAGHPNKTITARAREKTQNHTFACLPVHGLITPPASTLTRRRIAPLNPDRPPHCYAGVFQQIKR